MRTLTSARSRVFNQTAGLLFVTQAALIARMPRLALWPKVVFTLFMLAWTPGMWLMMGPRNFLWICDLCNFVLLAALWTESRLLFSSQTVAVLFIDIFWVVDVLSALFFGVHPIGGTEYMFNDAAPVLLRCFSLFHVFVPALLIWGICRLGYDRKGVLLQTAVTWIVLPLSYLLSTPEWDINWVYGLFGKPQHAMDSRLFLGVIMALYPVVVYLPTHAALVLVQRKWCSQRVNRHRYFQKRF